MTKVIRFDGAFYCPVEGSVPPPDGKRCSRCKRYRPFSDFRPNLKVSTGWDPWCRECHNEAVRRWRAENPEKARPRPVPPTGHVCPECGATFHGRKNWVVCSRRCKDARYARLHPVELAAKKRRKYARQRGQA
jgi:hypothetical protein